MASVGVGQEWARRMGMDEAAVVATGEFANTRLMDLTAMAGAALIVLLNVVLLLQTFGLPIPGLPDGG